MIKIELTIEEAELFKLFREHQDLFQTLLKAGVDDIANGKLILNYNYEGRLMDVERQVHYKVN